MAQEIKKATTGPDGQAHGQRHGNNSADPARCVINIIYDPETDCAGQDHQVGATPDFVCHPEKESARIAGLDSMLRHDLHSIQADK
jgi:hypothetical protein